MGANRRGVWGEESGTVGLTPRSEPSETTLRLWRETVACALGERGETGLCFPGKVLLTPPKPLIWANGK